MTSDTRRSRKLYKNPDEAIIAGVAAGVATYFDVDTTLVRALWAASMLAGGFGLIAYVILWIVLDDEPGPVLSAVGEAPPPAAEPVPPDEPSGVAVRLPEHGPDPCDCTEC